MFVENLIIAISLGIIAIMFITLAIFAIVTLLAIRKVIINVNDKIHSFDRFFRNFERNDSDSEERVCCRRCHNSSEKEEFFDHRKERILNTALEVADWAILGIALWQRLKERK